MPSPLYDLIAREAAQHPLTIARYMDWALQHPEHGYYRQRAAIGREGDFITAPEISQIFGELLGLWCIDIWWQLGRPERFTLLELGPGRGTLLADALRAAQRAPDFLRAKQLFLLESNAALRTEQATRLAAHQPQWLDDLAKLPPQPAIILANEFFDALPMRQFLHQETGWHERCIGVEAGKLGWVDVPCDATLIASLPEAQRALPVGSVAEYSASAQTVMTTCAQHIVQHGGALLAIDYGYAYPAGLPTFQAVARHGFADPLAEPGLADLTAHVDFLALEQTARATGAQVWDLQEQGGFLNALGLPQRAAQLSEKADAPQRAAIVAACARLTGPEAMGKLFKVLCVTKDDAIVPAGWVLD